MIFGRSRRMRLMLTACLSTKSVRNCLLSRRLHRTSTDKARIFSLTNGEAFLNYFAEKRWRPHPLSASRWYEITAWNRVHDQLLAAVKPAKRMLARLRHDPDVGLRRLPALRIGLLGVLVRH